MAKTKLLPSQTLLKKFNELVQQARTAITVNVKRLDAGRYLFNEKHARCGEEDWNNHYFFGFELVYGKSKFPTVTLLITDGEIQTIELQDWNSFDDLVWVLGELENESYQLEVESDEDALIEQ